MTVTGDFEAFLEATRVLVILAPLTPQTRDRFDRSELARLAPRSYVINVARGELLVEEALLSLLDSGHLAGAALDVFRQEPLPADHRFWTHPKILVTPHPMRAADASGLLRAPEVAHAGAQGCESVQCESKAIVCLCYGSSTRGGNSHSGGSS